MTPRWRARPGVPRGVGERGVEQDHGDDRTGKHPVAARPGQRRRHPQKQRERVRELPGRLW